MILIINFKFLTIKKDLTILKLITSSLYYKLIYLKLEISYFYYSIKFN